MTAGVAQLSITRPWINFGPRYLNFPLIPLQKPSSEDLHENPPQSAVALPAQSKGWPLKVSV
jgi:hypothetical protein